MNSTLCDMQAYKQTNKVKQKNNNPEITTWCLIDLKMSWKGVLVHMYHYYWSHSGITNIRVSMLMINPKNRHIHYKLICQCCHVRKKENPFKTALNVHLWIWSRITKGEIIPLQRFIIGCRDFPLCSFTAPVVNLGSWDLGGPGAIAWGSAK